MKIHITKAGESLSNIANEYGVDEEIIRNINEIKRGEPAEGEELLIIKPTRTYTAQYGDSVERIALRFDIPRRDIYLMNPHLCNKEITVGEKIILRICERSHGMNAANGYFYKGCGMEEFKRAIPYLTYVTFASAIADKNGVKKIFDDQMWVNMAINEEKIPLIRVYDKHTERFKSKSDQSDFANNLIKIAKEGGYKGIVLNSNAFSDSAENFVEFLMILRKQMIGCDLILITEADENTPYEFCEYADGGMLYYPKYAMNNAKSFAEGERRMFADFACNCESAKTFIDVPALSTMGKSFITISEANERARNNRYTILHNENTLLSHFSDRKQGECRFLSLRGLNELFELVKEFDFMGVCFDIMRTPLSHLLMYNSLFKSYYATSVRSREGCSRADAE